MQGIERNTDTDQEKQITYEGVTLLIGAIFRITAQDLRYGSRNSRKGARSFINSGWFNFLCDGMNVEPAFVKRLINGAKVKSRSNYE